MLHQIQWMVLFVFKRRKTIVYDGGVIIDDSMIHDNLDDAVSVFKAFKQILDVRFSPGMVSLIILRHIHDNPGCSKTDCLKEVTRARCHSSIEPAVYRRGNYYGRLNLLSDFYYVIGKKLYLTSQGYEELNRLESYCSLSKKCSTSAKVDLANEVNNGRE